MQAPKYLHRKGRPVIGNAGANMPRMSTPALRNPESVSEKQSFKIHWAGIVHSDLPLMLFEPLGIRQKKVAMNLVMSALPVLPRRRTRERASDPQQKHYK